MAFSQRLDAAMAPHWPDHTYVPCVPNLEGSGIDCDLAIRFGHARQYAPWPSPRPSTIASSLGRDRVGKNRQVDRQSGECPHGANQSFSNSTRTHRDAFAISPFLPVLADSK